MLVTAPGDSDTTTTTTTTPHHLPSLFVFSSHQNFRANLFLFFLQRKQKRRYIYIFDCLRLSHLAALLLLGSCHRLARADRSLPEKSPPLANLVTSDFNSRSKTCQSALACFVCGFKLNVRFGSQVGLGVGRTRKVKSILQRNI